VAPVSGSVPRAGEARRASEADVGSLVVRARAGDRTAWDALVRRYLRMLLGIARSYGLDEAAAQDVVQVTWLQLAQRLDQLREPHAVGAWLATTARRESLRQRRAAARERPVEAELFHERAAPGRVDDRVMMAERDRALWSAFKEIGERCQLLLRLLLAELPYVEIAAALEMPVGSIGPTRQRCLAALRKKVTAAGIEAAPEDSV